MILEQLSSYTVKIRLLPSELPMLLQESDPASTEKLLLFLIERAEAFSRIPFRRRQVTVELLPTEQGGLTAYLTAKPMKHAGVSLRAEAFFSDDPSLAACCHALLPHLHTDTISSLYRIHDRKLLVLRQLPTENRMIQHILKEYASPCSVSFQVYARLEEYGDCLYKDHAIEMVAESRAI